MADQGQIDSTLADSIAMLEQILEVMPQDIDAIKALYTAYSNGGKQDHAFHHLSSLVNVVSGGGGGADVLVFIQNELPRFEEFFPAEVAAQSARLRMLSGLLEPDSVAEEEVDPAREGALPKKVEVDISEELSLAWRLYEENQLSQEEYSSVINDLTEVSSKELNVPVSVLHVLNDRGFPQMTRILNFLSSRSGTPYLSLSNFEQNEKMAGVLPLGFSAHEGALPFSFLGNDLLVAVLNPFNTMLMDKIEEESGHRCHTYLVEPDDYDMALEKLRELAAAKV